MIGIELLVPICIGALGAASGGAYLVHSKVKTHTESLTYLKKGDPEAQKAYEAHKNPKIDNDINASWEFLYAITKEVVTTISEEEKKQIADAGKLLLGLGCNYVHVPKYSMHHQKPAVASSAVAEGQEQQRS